ncbi:PDZ/DHR/GLGF domain protein [Ostertagia ostertagi]
MRKSVHCMDADTRAMPPPPVPPRPPRLPPARAPAAPVPRGLPRSYPVEFPIDIPSTSSYSSCTENHRSQVYLNGLVSDEDTLVRVKHRREKSNSLSNVANGAARRLRVRSTASSTTTEGDDASGSAGVDGVESEEEDDDGSCPSHESFVDLKDSVRECLEKEPSERNAEDLAVLLDFMQHMSSFASLPMSIKRQLCLKMVFAVVNDAGTVVMHHNEKLDAWSVIVNGLVEVVKPNGERVEYKLGDSFGAEPNPAVQYHVGEMRTIVDDCEFVLVEHKDFCSIMSTISEHIEKDRDGLTGEVVSEMKEELVSIINYHYIREAPDDGLLTERLGTRVLWSFEQSLLNIAVRESRRSEARPRTVVYSRANKDDALHFSIQGGKECGCGIFVSEVQPDSPAERCGLKRGDEILEINGQPMKYLTLAKAYEILKGSISLAINLKSNILGFKELLGKAERDGSKTSAKNKALAGVLAHSRGSVPNVIPVKAAKTIKFTGHKTSMMDKLMTILKSTKDGEDTTDDVQHTTTSQLRPSRSNPDITSISQYYGPVKSECPEHVLKIYRSDQTFKYLAVYKETTAQNVVQLALQLDKARLCEAALTWERVSGVMWVNETSFLYKFKRIHFRKYIRMLEDVQQLVDPSRNMSKYRQHLAEVSQEPPVVPIYPVIRKDLTFSHEGNPTYCDKLVNFEKLRLIAKSVRAVSKLSSAPYEISSMAARSGNLISDALLHMNTFEGGNVATMRKGGRVVQPRKKVYEQALMVRKVKAYLDGLRVVDSNLSWIALATILSRNNQSAESNSTEQRRFKGGGMFGVDSPQAVQKMLGLVQTSRSKGAASPMPSPASSVSTKGLQRNVPRVSARQHSTSVQRTPSFKQEPVDLNKESSSVTSFYGAGTMARQPFPVSTKPPHAAITVVQPARYNKRIIDRSPHSTNLYPVTVRSSLCSAGIYDSVAPYYSLKRSMNLQNYAAGASAAAKENSAKEVSFINGEQSSHI